MAQQSRLSRKMMMAAAGNASQPLYVDDVFSTYVYEGTAADHTITNGIDLAGEGGMTWIKCRTNGTTGFYGMGCIFDTERGVTNQLMTPYNDAEGSGSYGTINLNSFNSDGFEIYGLSDPLNELGHDYVSWTFRKHPKFFNVVTYTGNGTTNFIDHGLECQVGLIIIKRTDSTSDWGMAWRVSNTQWYTDISLNSTAGAGSASIGTSDITSTQFNANAILDDGSNAMNINTGSYVAYIFAHNNGDGGFGKNGDEDIIKVGYEAGNAGNQIADLGFEPQYVMTHLVNIGTHYEIYDSIRGLGGSTGINNPAIYANSTNAESNFNNHIDINPTGFQWRYYDNYGMIYIAIRRPHKPAESGTDVFAVDTGSSSSTKEFDSTFPVDFSIFKNTASASNGSVGARLTQGTTLQTNATSAETASTAFAYDYMDGFYDGAIGSNYLAWMFKRSPGFMDVVCYEGNSTNDRVINHNLNVTPEMIITKSRDATRNWVVYHKDLTSGTVLLLNNPIGEATGSFYTTVSGTNSYTVPSNTSTNFNNEDYIAILFATQDGISKVGSYTGNGTSQTIDCGFTTGARFVLINRKDDVGDWFVWDSVRGIVAGNDPFLVLNDTDAEDTLSSGTGAAGDHLDPDSSGFIVNETSGVAINTSSAEYIYLAIA